MKTAMKAIAQPDFTTAADILRLDQARRALAEMARADGFYAPREERYDPADLSPDSLKIRVLRKARDSADGRLPAEVEDYILAKPETVTLAVPPTRTERVGTVLAILSALLLAPFAVLAGLLALADPDFTGFGDEVLPIAFARHLVFHATQAEVTGYLAAAAMLLTFSMTNKVLLRLFAVIANIFFISYGLTTALVPVVLLHTVLLPVNLGHLGRALHNQGARIEMQSPKAAAPAHATAATR